MPWFPALQSRKPRSSSLPRSVDRAARRRLRIEHLEARELLAIDLFVDDAFAGLNNGDAIADADSGTPGAQPATFNVTAFASINAALGVAAIDDTLVVNDGTYNEVVNVTGNQTIRLTGAATPSNIVIASLDTSATTLINLQAHTLTVGDAAGAHTIAGVIQGSGGLVKQGADTLTLSGVNTYTGNTLISQGLVIAGTSSISAGSFGAFNASPSKIVVQNGATLDVNGRAAAGRDFFYGVTITGSGTSGQGALVNNGDNGGTGQRQTPFITLAGNATIGGTGNIYMINGGYAANTLNLAGFTLTKVGTNTFGFINTTVTAGNLHIASGTVTHTNIAANLTAANVSLTDTAGATLALNGLNMTVGSLSGGGATGGNVSLGGNTLTINQASTTTYAGIISGTGGITKAGTGTLTLGGLNTFTGNVLISQGMLIAGASNTATGALGAFNAAPTKVVVQSGATLDVNGRAAPGLDFYYGVTISGSGTSGQGALINNGPNHGGGNVQLPFITLAGNATVGGSGNFYMINGGYSPTTLDLAGYTLTKSGTNTVYLVNTTATAGNIHIAGGTLSQVTRAANLSAAHLSLANTAGATLALNGFDLAVASLAGGGTTGGNISLGANTLTINQASTTTYAGIISGTGGITKSGSGTLTIAGLNTYTGNTLITQGMVIAGASSITSGAFGAFNSSPSKIVVQSGATLDVNGSAAPGLDFYYGVTISGSGTSGQGALINNGPNHGGGNVQLPFITLAGNATVGGSGNFYLLNYGYGATTLDLAGFTLTKTGTNTMFLVNTTVTAGNIHIDSGTLSQATNPANLSAANVSLANNASAALALNGLNLTVGSLSGGGATGGNVAIGGNTLTINQAINTTFAGAFSGTGILFKSGTGTLTLSGVSPFTGQTRIAAGIVQLAGGANRLSPSSNLYIEATGTLDLNGQNQAFNSVTLAHGTVLLNGGAILTVNNGDFWANTTLTGTGGLTKASGGVLTFGAGTANYTGGTIVQDGRLWLYFGNNKLPITGDVTVNSPGVLDLAHPNNPGTVQTIGRLLGNGTVNIGNAGSAVNLVVGNGGGTGAFSGTIANGAGTVSLTKTGTGTQSLNGASTYTGGTVISQGTLQIGVATGAGTGAVTLNDANTGANNTAFLASFANAGAAISNPITVANLGTGTSSIGTTVFNVGGVPTRWNGTITLNKATTFTGGNADRTSYEGVITGPAGTITVTGGARTTWDNTNTFVGNVQLVGSGTILQMNGSTNVIPDASNVDVGAGTFFYSNNASETIAGLTGTGTVQRHPAVTGTFTLTVGSGNASSTFGGVIANGGGTVALTKIGTGTLTLTGSNTFSGITTINGGVISVPALAGGNTASPLGAALGFAANLVFNGGTLRYTGATSYVGPTAINRPFTILAGGGTIEVTNAAATVEFDSRSGANSPVGSAGLLTLAGAGNGFMTQVLGASFTGGVRKIGTGTWTLNPSIVYNAGYIPVSPTSVVVLTGTTVANLGAVTAAVTTGVMNGAYIGFDAAASIYNYVNDGTTATFAVAFFDGTYTKAVKIQLSNSGGNVVATALAARYWNGNVLSGFNFDTTPGANNQSIATSNGTAGYGVKSLTFASANAYTGTTTVDGGTLALAGGNAIVDTGAVSLANAAGVTLALSHPETIGSLTGGGTTGGNVNLGANTLTVGGNNTNTIYSGVLTGSGGLTKIGTGALLLQGTSTYTGPTLVSTGTLGGNGSITSPLTVSGTGIFAPGGTPGTFTSLAAVFQPGGQFQAELTGTGPDRLNVNGNINLTGSILTVTGSVTPPPGTAYVLIAPTGSITGTFQGLPEGAKVFVGGVAYNITYGNPSGIFPAITNGTVALVRNREVVAVADNFAPILEDATLSANVKANDTDLDFDGVVTIVSGPSQGSFTSFNFATGAFVYVPTAHFSGTDSFTYTLFDGENTSGPVTATITITAVADVPNLTVSNAAGSENTIIPLNIASSLVDTNGTPNEVLSIVISGVPAATTLSAGTPSGGGSTYTLTAAELVGLTLIKDDNDFNNAPFTLQVVATTTEGNGSTASTPATALIVTVQNSAPVPTLEEVLIDGVAEASIPSSIASVPGIPITFRVSASDLVADEQDKPYRFTLVWAPGVVQTQTVDTLADTLEFTYDYPTATPPQSFVPTLTVQELDTGNPLNGDNAATTISLPSIVFSNIVQIDDTLYVGGTTGADRIVVQSGSAGIAVRFNNLLSTSYSVSDVIVYGNAGNDTITITGAANVPVEFYGGAGNDYLAGGALDDILDGGDGTDRLLAGGGHDLLYGGAGNDTLSGGVGDDVLYGDSYLDRNGDVQLPATALQGKDNLSGDAGNDKIYGEGNVDVLYGGAGSDLVRGGEGNDTASGDDGDDTLTGDGGTDKLYGRAGNDVLLGGLGLDTLYGGTGEDLLFGNAMDDETDGTLEAIYLDWFGFDQASAAQQIKDAARPTETVADMLYGEGGRDWYLMYITDKVAQSTEKPTDNTIDKF